MAEEKRIDTGDATLARDGLTGSGGIVQAVAEAAASGAVGAVAGQVTAKLINRPKNDEQPPRIHLPPGTKKPE